MSKERGESATLKTVVIQTKPNKDNPSGHVEINESDYDAKVHKLAGEVKEKQETPKEKSAREKQEKDDADKAAKDGK